MPVLSLACHLPHNTPNIPSRYNNEQTTKQTKAINNSYIYISHVNVTQTVPDISPLMPMHQDPLLVSTISDNRCGSASLFLSLGQLVTGSVGYWECKLIWEVTGVSGESGQTALTSNGSWCMGIKGEMSGTVCVTFTWYMYIYELFIAFVCFVVCSLL